MEETLLAWMAGFFDGEGSIGLKYIEKNNGSISFKRRVCIVNTRQDILEVFYKYFGGSVKESIHQRKYNPNAKPIFVWTVSCKKAAYFIGLILPFLKLKSLVATLFMDYDYWLNNRPIYGRRMGKNNCFNDESLESIKARKYIVNTITKLNHRGKCVV